MRIRIVLSALLLVWFTACSYGEAEFQLYSKAFDTQYVEGSKVFDRLSTSERILQKRVGNASGSSSFDPNLASVYLEVGDPPLTASLRASLDALKSYNDAMTGLTTGASASSLTAKIGTASTALNGTLGALAGVTGTAAELAGNLSGKITVVLPLLELALRARDRWVFREQLLDAYPDMEALLLELRSGTSTMFFVMRESSKTRGSLDTADGLSSQARDALQNDRKLLAGWVLLVDRTLIAMRAARDAVAAGSGSANLNELVDATVEIEATAQAIKAAN